MPRVIRNKNNRTRNPDGTPNATDLVVGQRLKERRTILGLSQQQVAEAVGLTFQQVQKYERGTNRIGASRLYQLSQVLDVPVGFFFEGAANDSKSNIRGFAEDSAAFSHETTVEKREALELLRIFNSIPTGKPRQRVMALIRTAALATGAEPVAKKPGRKPKKK